MRPRYLAATLLVSILGLLAGCSRDPNVAKVRYVESGNKYFQKGKYKEARIMYLDALQKDKRYGPAYYHLALTALKLGPVNEAVGVEFHCTRRSQIFKASNVAP